MLLEVHGRSARQWLLSAIAYCEFRSGDAWHSPLDRTHRNSEDRWAWIDAIRLMLVALHSSVNLPVQAARPVRSAPPPSPLELKLLDWRLR